MLKIPPTIAGTGQYQLRLLTCSARKPCMPLIPPASYTSKAKPMIVRIGRLLALLLLYQAGYEVGRYISLERIIEESKETYYESLYKSSQNWHKGEHDLRPWWNYFQGMLIAAYNEFEARVGTITKAQGAKREMVENAIRRLPPRFRISDVQHACPTVSYPTLKRALSVLSKKKLIRVLGKGRDAQWERI
jgi:Fic family protein